MSIEQNLDGFVSALGPCPPIPKRELLHRDPEEYLCAVLAVLEWGLEKNHELADYISAHRIPCTVSEHVLESEIPQLKPSIQETGTQRIGLTG
jgi:hypothetical protein